MDIKIPHSWLKDHLDTKAQPAKIGECLALCGPSFERLHKVQGDFVYDIEITTNRMDTASVRGIAREAAAILPQFGIPAKLKEFNPKLPQKTTGKLTNLIIKTDPKLNKRVMAVVIDNVTSTTKSPAWIKDRLELSGVRSLNLLVDITNYVMLEVGHPTHVFDLDKLTDNTLNFRLSKKGEHTTSFDGKTYSLPGNDIVIENKKGEIIDLPGIIGTKNSVVNKETKRIVFFLDNNDPLLMRKTSLSLGIRTMAVQLNEKNVDPQLGDIAMARGIELYTKLAQGKVVSKVYDFYHIKYKEKKLTVSQDFINQRLGIEISNEKIKNILSSLEFFVNIKNNNFEISIPSFRQNDVMIPEDIVEEIARIYGYHNIPSTLMATPIPSDHDSSLFDFEKSIKLHLKATGACEIYTTSLVSKEEAGENALRVKNPLGGDTEYLRTTLYHTTIRSVLLNKGIKDKLHLFEVANVYIPQRNNLPKEIMTLAGGFANFSYREAKGIIESLLEVLHIDPLFESIGQGIVIKSKNDVLGKFIKSGVNYYYEFDTEALRKYAKQYVPFKSLPKYPAQIEDITAVLSDNVLVGELISKAKKLDSLISEIELIDIYKDSFTFRIWYQHPEKTLTDKEVEKVRLKITKFIEKEFKGLIKA